jgi:hypothetical protein
VTSLDAAADRLLAETGSTGADNQYGIRSETYLRRGATHLPRQGARHAAGDEQATGGRPGPHGSRSGRQAAEVGVRR